MSTPDSNPQSQSATTNQRDCRGRLGILGRYPIVSVVAFALVGILFGVLLSKWEPDNENIKTVTITWIGLVGALFIRSLKAIVLPLVFVNVTLSMCNMMMVGRASTVGSKALILYGTTTLLGASIGLISILSFREYFQQEIFKEPAKPMIQLGCTEPGYLLSVNTTDGNLRCSNATSPTSDETFFEIMDLSAGLISTDSVYADLSMSETIYEGVFMKLITDNVFSSFMDGNFAAVVVFATVFGISLGRNILEKGLTVTTGCQVVELLQEISDVLLKIINWIITCTPFAVLSLITNAIGSKQNLSETFSNVGYLIAANVIGLIIHFFVTDVAFFFLASGINPFQYLKHIIPAQATAFASASSAASLPVTMRCIKNTGLVADDIRNFVCPLGSTINMDGTALFFPCACIWLAALNGVQLHLGLYILVLILSVIGSLGTAPVPSASLVLVMTAFNTITGMSGVPDGFEYLVAIDWLLDRCRTTLNVTGDAVVAGIISARLEPALSYKDILSSR